MLDYWRAISSRGVMLAALSLAGLAAGIAVTLSQAPTYLAKTSIEIQDVKGDNLAAKILNPQPEVATVDSPTDIQTQVKILQSQSLLDGALEKAHISTVADLGRDNSWLARFSSPASGRDHDRLIEQVVKSSKGYSRQRYPHCGTVVRSEGSRCWPRGLRIRLRPNSSNRIWKRAGK